MFGCLCISGCFMDSYTLCLSNHLWIWHIFFDKVIDSQGISHDFKPVTKSLKFRHFFTFFSRGVSHCISHAYIPIRSSKIQTFFHWYFTGIYVDAYDSIYEVHTFFNRVFHRVACFFLFHMFHSIPIKFYNHLKTFT